MSARGGSRRATSSDGDVVKAGKSVASVAVRCPSCGGTAPDTEFTFQQTYRATGTGVINGLDADGKLQVEWIATSDPERFYRPSLMCGDCNHEWTTNRPWVAVR